MSIHLIGSLLPSFFYYYKTRFANTSLLLYLMLETGWPEYSYIPLGIYGIYYAAEGYVTSRFDDYWLTNSVDQYASMRDVTSLSATRDDWVSLEVPFNLSLALGGIFFFVGKVDGLGLFQIINEEVIVTGIAFFANNITINNSSKLFWALYI